MKIYFLFYVCFNVFLCYFYHFVLFDMVGFLFTICWLKLTHYMRAIRFEYIEFGIDCVLCSVYKIYGMFQSIFGVCLFENLALGLIRMKRVCYNKQMLKIFVMLFECDLYSQPKCSTEIHIRQYHIHNFRWQETNENEILHIHTTTHK